MKITSYETHDRKLLVEFKCRRCETTAIRPLEECVKECADGYRNLYDLRPPEEWKDGGFYYHMFCPRCKEAYERFMNNEEL